MVKRFAASIIFLCTFASGLISSQETTTPNVQQDQRSIEQILLKILERAKQNDEPLKKIGFQQLTVNKKLKDGRVADEETKLYRLIWIENQPYLELKKIDGSDLNTKQKKEEAERRAKFLKLIHKKEKEEDDGDDITWDQIHEKYDFELLPPDGVARYAFSFHPKKGKLTERSRVEKVINHLSGKFWADEQYGIVGAEAKLLENVRFGLGILGNLEKLEAKYTQQRFENILVPSSFFVHYKARALVKIEERQIQGTYSDYFHRSDSPPSK